jgi:hypothetical protein
MVGTDLEPSLTADEAGQLAMMQIVLIGVGGGAAAALLFASVVSGSPVATVLYYLSPLPILIAAMGWSHWAALVAVLSAVSGLTAILGIYFATAFLIGVGAPAWWLGYLALLARPATAPAAVEWYPIGRLVLWAALIGAMVVIVVIPTFGTDKESFQAGLRGAFERAIRLQAPAASGVPDSPEAKRLIDILVLATPAAAAVVTTLISVVNLWLAGLIVKVSGRLRRPWPDLSSLALPPIAAGLLAATVAGSFLPDLAGILSSVLAGSLLLAYALVGFAVLHAITRSFGNRGLALTGAYAAVVVGVWPLLGVSLLGLADGAFDIRGYVARKGGPPNPRT